MGVCPHSFPGDKVPLGRKGRLPFSFVGPKGPGPVGAEEGAFGCLALFAESLPGGQVPSGGIISSSESVAGSSRSLVAASSGMLQLDSGLRASNHENGVVIVARNPPSLPGRRRCRFHWLTVGWEDMADLKSRFLTLMPVDPRCLLRLCASAILPLRML